jgi:hypothetical protein
VRARFALCAALVAGLPALLAVPASAQALLSPYDIATGVQSMGLEPISRPVQRGARYVFRAIDGRGVEVKVAADAFSGRILAVRRVGEGGGPAFAERYAPPSYYGDENARAPRGRYEPPTNYDRQGSYDPRSYGPPQPDQRGGYQSQPRYEQRGNYEGQSSRAPADPPVIYAPRDSAAIPQAPGRAPNTAKPAALKVAAKPPARPAPSESAGAPADVQKKEQPSEAANGASTAYPSSAAAKKNSALSAPPVQAFE